MKTIITVLMLVLITPIYAQYGECKCNDLFDKDIRTKDTRYSRQDIKEKIYEYLLATEDKRRNIQQNLDIGSTTTSIINAIPVINEFSLSGSNKKIH